jgi:hypothetical protein
MGCCSGNVDFSNNMSFDKESKRIITSEKPINKESYNNFLSNFNEKIQNINGKYISKDDFDSIIPEKIQNYMKENPLKREKEIVKKSTYDVEPFEFKNGNIYQGKWNKNMEFDGPGTYYLQQDKVFIEGDWEKGNFSYGRIFYPNGDIYEGQIKDSKPNGKGELKTLNNERYEGDFVNGEKTGKGKIIFEDGTIYEGNIENGKFKGNGKMIWTNGYEYNGEFDGATLKGKGILKMPNGDIYEGDFDNNLFHGKGKYTYNKNGNEYEGDFQYGIKKGKGIYTCINEYIYDGYWDNDLPCGFGKLTNWEKNGILKCIWRFGRIAEEPVYEIGNEENFSQVDLNIKLDEMDVNKKELPHLEYIENDSTQYVIKTSLSFLSE